MSPIHAVFLHAGFVGFTLVILVFLLFVPFYRTFVGWIVFFVKVNFWLILLLALLLYHGVEQNGVLAETLRSILYPSTTATGFSLCWVVLRAQVEGRKARPIGTSFFDRAGREAS